jgi:hypothetical protein
MLGCSYFLCKTVRGVTSSDSKSMTYVESNCSVPAGFASACRPTDFRTEAHLFWLCRIKPLVSWGETDDEMKT